MEDPRSCTESTLVLLPCNLKRRDKNWALQEFTIRAHTSSFDSFGDTVRKHEKEYNVEHENENQGSYVFVPPSRFLF